MNGHSFPSVSERKDVKCTKCYPSKTQKQGQAQTEQPCEYYTAILAKMIHMSVTSSIRETKRRKKSERLRTVWTVAEIIHLHSAQHKDKSAVIVINWRILWKSAVLNPSKNWRIVTQRATTPSQIMELKCSLANLLKTGMKNMQLIVNYKPIQFKLDFGAEVSVLTKNYLNDVIPKTQTRVSLNWVTRPFKQHVGDVTFASLGNVFKMPEH